MRINLFFAKCNVSEKSDNRRSSLRSVFHLTNHGVDMGSVTADGE